ncbi:uncharacterized protein V6R79_002289 [Siganus canaliculatus]
MGKQKDILQKLAGTFRIQHVLLCQALAECLGTLILVMFGCGAVAQLVLSRGSHGTFLSVNFAFGFAAALGVVVSGQVSGGHLNPAVTFAMCLLGREPWRKFPLFFFFQTLGAFLGAGIVFSMYLDALWDYSHGELTVLGHNATAGIFATYPSSHLSLLNGFFDQSTRTTTLSLEARSHSLWASWCRSSDCPWASTLVMLLIQPEIWGHASSPLPPAGGERFS